MATVSATEAAAAADTRTTNRYLSPVCFRDNFAPIVGTRCVGDAASERDPSQDLSRGFQWINTYLIRGDMILARRMRAREALLKSHRVQLNAREDLIDLNLTAAVLVKELSYCGGPRSG
jgi:hypothetical protein